MFWDDLSVKVDDQPENFDFSLGTKSHTLYQNRRQFVSHAVVWKCLELWFILAGVLCRATLWLAFPPGYNLDTHLFPQTKSTGLKPDKSNLCIKQSLQSYVRGVEHSN